MSRSAESDLGQETRRITGKLDVDSGGYKILIYDQDIEDLTRQAQPFEDHCFEVHKCATVDSAMRAAEREEFELAIVGQASPSSEARRVMRHLIRYSPATPLIVAGRLAAAGCLEALEFGASEYLEKPISVIELNRVIRTYLIEP